MFRKIWAAVVLTAAAFGFAAATAGPASAGIVSNHCEPLVRH